MVVTEALLDKKIDNLQHQLDTMQRGDTAFKGYVHRQFGSISRQIAGMATKEDLRLMEARLFGDLAGMATKQDVNKIEGNLNKLTTLVGKIAEKIGVST